MDNELRRFDAEWFTKQLGETIFSVEWNKVDTQGSISGVKKVQLLTSSKDERHFVVKILLTTSDHPVSVGVGVAREADFYNSVRDFPSDKRKLLEAFLPKVLHAESDWKNGGKKIIMEGWCYFKVDTR